MVRCFVGSANCQLAKNDRPQQISQSVRKLLIELLFFIAGSHRFDSPPTLFSITPPTFFFSFLWQNLLELRHPPVLFALSLSLSCTLSLSLALNSHTLSLTLSQLEVDGLQWELFLNEVTWRCPNWLMWMDFFFFFLFFSLRMMLEKKIFFCPKSRSFEWKKELL